MFSFSEDDNGNSNIVIDPADIAVARSIYSLLLSSPELVHADTVLDVLSRIIASPSACSPESDMAAENVLTYIRNTPLWGRGDAREIVIANLTELIAFAYDVRRKINRGELGVTLP